MKTIKILPTAILFLSILSASLSAGDLKPVEPKKEDKCQVCGMFVAKYRHWIAEIIYKDGTYAMFDGPKDMFKYYLNMAKYAPSKNPSDLAALYVTEYYSTELKDAKKLFYVTGSDVYGPMGDELIPLSTETAAKEFMKDHKGTKILKFTEVTNDILH